MFLNLRFFFIIYCTKEQQGSFTISLSALKRSVVLLLNSRVFSSLDLINVVGLSVNKTAQTLKKINHHLNSFLREQFDFSYHNDIYLKQG